MGKVEQTTRTNKQAPYYPFATIMKLSDEQYDMFTNLKEEELSVFVSLLQEGVDKLFRGEEIKSKESAKLLNAMLLLAYHRREEAFYPLLHLSDLDDKYLTSVMGENFLFEDWPRLLAATAKGHWEPVRDVIDEGHVSENILGGLLASITKMVLTEDADRSAVMAWLRSRFDRFAKTEDEDPERIALYVSMAYELWPGECLEEIRELYGLRMVETWSISMDCVLRSYGKGMEQTLSYQRESFHTAPFIFRMDPDVNEEDFSEEQLQKLKDAVKKLQEVEVKGSLEKFRKGQQLTAGRNDLCPCGSGKKFKKCCMAQEKKQPSAVKTVTMEITSEPLEDIRKQYDPEDALEIERLYYKLGETPESCIAPLKAYIAKYPDIPALYNHLYQCLAQVGKSREAHQLLLQIVEKFPDYLFGIMEYAMYFLRRGELEKFDEVVRKTRNLTQLYPERKVFHISEVMCHSYSMGVYCLKLGNVRQADVYLRMLEQLDAESENTLDLRRKIELFLRQKDLEGLLS